MMYGIASSRLLVLSSVVSSQHKNVLCGVLFAAGDYLGQCLSELQCPTARPLLTNLQAEPYLPSLRDRFIRHIDEIRIVEFSLLGTLLGGYLCYVYGEFSSKCKNPLEKFALTHLCFIPLGYFALIGGFTLINERFNTSNVINRFHEKYPKIFTLHYCTWPIVNILSRITPNIYANILQAVTSLGYVAFLSQELHDSALYTYSYWWINENP